MTHLRNLISKALRWLANKIAPKSTAPTVKPAGGGGPGEPPDGQK